jgi:Stigma-specific protein, Stig1
MHRWMMVAGCLLAVLANACTKPVAEGSSSGTSSGQGSGTASSGSGTAGSTSTSGGGGSTSGSGTGASTGSVSTSSSSSSSSGGSGGGDAGGPCSGLNVGCPADQLCVANSASNPLCLSPYCPSGSEGRACAFGAPTVGTCCGGACINPLHDPANCGACGVGCTSHVCLGAPNVCLPAADSPCPDGGAGSGGSCYSTGCTKGNDFCKLSDGGGVGACLTYDEYPLACRDVLSEPRYCGGSGCQATDICTQGVCGADQPCGPGGAGRFCGFDGGAISECCPGVGCIDVSSDLSNCGACGNACVGMPCIDGECLVAYCTPSTEGRDCTTGSAKGTCCSNACVDTRSSDQHCGSCNRLCSSPQHCDAGMCQ